MLKAMKGYDFTSKPKILIRTVAISHLDLCLLQAQIVKLFFMSI